MLTVLNLSPHLANQYRRGAKLISPDYPTHSTSLAIRDKSACTANKSVAGVQLGALFVYTCQSYSRCLTHSKPTRRHLLRFSDYLFDSWNCTGDAFPYVQDLSCKASGVNLAVRPYDFKSRCGRPFKIRLNYTV